MKTTTVFPIFCLAQLAFGSTGCYVASYGAVPRSQTVGFPPSKRKVTQTVGKQLRFLCYKPFGDATTFVWRFNSFEIPMHLGLQDGLYTYKITSGHLQLRNIAYSILDMGPCKKAHAGNYSCHVFTRGSLKQALQVRLHVADDNESTPLTRAPRRPNRYGIIRSFRVVSRLRDAPCDDDEQCASVDLVSLCHEGRCICAPGYYLNDTTCLKYVGLGAHCGAQSVCRAPSLECKAGRCVCLESAVIDDPNGECNVVTTSGLFTKVVLYASLAIACAAILFLAGAVLCCGKKYNLKEQFQGAFYVNCCIL